MMNRRDVLKVLAITPLVLTNKKANAFLPLVAAVVAGFAIRLLARSAARYFSRNVIRSIGRTAVSQGIRKIPRGVSFSAIAAAEMESMTAEAADQILQVRLFATKLGYTNSEVQSVCAIWECGVDSNVLELYVENNNSTSAQVSTDFFIVIKDVKTGNLDLVQKTKLLLPKDSRSVIKLAIGTPDKTGVKQVYGISSDKNITVSEPLLVVVEKGELIDAVS